MGCLTISQVPDKPALSVTIIAEDMKCLYPLTQNLRLMFDLNTDSLLIANTFQYSRPLNNMVKRSPGLRLSRFWDPFEGAVCTILGQLVSLAQARKMIGRLVENYGETIVNPMTGENTNLFPTPKLLSNAKIDEIGTTKIRAKAINDLSEKVLDGSIIFDSSRDNNTLRKTLLSIKGVGPWTADYIALRALGEPDVFPAQALILKRSLGEYPDIKLEDSAPYRSYLAAHMWHEHSQNNLNKEAAK